MSDLYNYKATFISAHSANTLTTDIDLGFGAWLYHEKLHLSGIIVPQLNGKEKPKGIAARDFVRELLIEGDQIEIKTYKDDGSNEGHWQAEVILPDGRSLNKVLLGTVHARPK